MSRRNSTIAAVAIAILGLLAWALQPTPERVALATAERGHLAVSVTEEGRTRVRERYAITAPVAAWIPRLALEPGDAVRQGQVLVRLQPVPATALDPRAHAEAEARLERARAALQAEQARLEAARAVAEHARADFERLEDLGSSQNVSQRELAQTRMEARRREAELDAARFAVEIARHEVTVAETRLRYTGEHQPGAAIPVESPIDGRVLARENASAGVVSAGTPLLTLGNPQSLEAVIDVRSEDAVRIEAGMAVRFHRWGGDHPLSGRVRRVEPSGFTEVSALGVEEQRVRVIADFDGADAARALGDRYRLDAEFILWQGEDVLQIPESALFETDTGHAVFVAADGIARRRAVSVGHLGGLAVEITEGLAPGDRVILQPGNAIEDGARIAPFGEPAS